MDLRIIPAYEHPQEVLELFTEYTEMLFEGDPAIRQYLEMQNYDEEIRNLEYKYGHPHGRLYLAYSGGELAGCIGLRNMPELNGNDAPDGAPDNAPVFDADSDACEDSTTATAGTLRFCEMKRLFVKPEFRGNGIAHALIQTVIDDARAIGYSHMLLDTLPFLESAIRLYRSFGFYEIPPYNNSPVENSIFMRLDM